MDGLDSVVTGAREFWGALGDVWERGVLGSSIGDLALALLAIAVGFLFRGLIVAVVLGFFARLAKRTRMTFDDNLVKALDPPLRIAPVILGFYIAFAVLGFDTGGESLLGSVLRSAVAIMVFWTLVRLVDPVFESSTRLKKLFRSTILEWTKNTLKAFIGFLGAAAVLGEWGIQIAPIIAGLGIFGAAVALGAQDLFKNLLGGLAVLAERRFGPGDWILVDGVVEGTVEKIGFRSTHVRRFDKSPVYVPNAQLADNAVTNFSRMTHRRIKWAIGVEYGTTADQLKIIRDGVADYIEGNDDFAQSDEVTWFIRVDAFNDSSIDFLLYCFTKTTNWTEWLEIKERLALHIKEVVEGAGTGFAFPSRTIYLAGGEEGEAAEPFTPPKGA
ncbi:MAG: mechanosensitive ion channel family protein [Maricaulaceae bacterium]